LKKYAKNYTLLSDSSDFLNKISTEVLAKDFLIDYFMGYFDTIVNLADYKADKRRFEDIIDVIFVSLSWIHKNELKIWNQLVKKYKFDQERLLELMNFKEQIIAGTSIVSMMGMPGRDIKAEHEKSAYER
ncbi:MAG: hypothetical protein KGH49_04100, partial [Candidatus Micrarchaeota archaeon]|nr:hypothetical protein [Candidatus Micrarchaeota archaeon]